MLFNVKNTVNVVCHVSAARFSSDFCNSPLNVYLKHEYEKVCNTVITVTVKLNQKRVKVCNTVITVRKDLYPQSNEKQT